MSPVGSYESLTAAIHAGANSVYFGIEQLNMRAHSSNNFSFDDLKNIVEICNQAKIKTYLTVNTIIYDNEIEKMHKVVDAAAENRVSAIIASDMAVINYAKKKNVEVHASTQLNVSNIESVEFFSKFCDVIVTARELSLTQVAEITGQIKEKQIKGPKGNLVKIEIFCHGALCMAVSGKCYLSLHQYNSSANRGACFQTCRRGYRVTDIETDDELNIENEYIMSPKDLSTIAFIDKIIEAGVSVFKIEGRARSAEYVKTVTRCYDEAIKSYFAGTYSQEKIENWQTQLSTVFNRGFWNGYYLGQRLGEWSEVYGSKATKIKVFIGKIVNYFSNIGVAEIKFETDEILSVNDEIFIIGPTTGVVEQTIIEIREDLKSVNNVTQSSLFSIKTEEIVRRGDKLYKLLTNGKTKSEKS
jgi:putative protease